MENDQKALATFVSENKIKQRTCSYYVEDDKSETKKCMCGRSQEWHGEKGTHVQTHDRWDYKTHTKPCPADSFGIIEFQDFGRETFRSPYIRLSPDTNIKTVWTLLTHHWKIPIPKLLISVTGGAQGYDLNLKKQVDFIERLINAATSTGAWIITGGTATGVAKVIGDAVRNHRITSSSTTNEIIALGIASWGDIANTDALEGNGDKGLFPATYSLEDVPEIDNLHVPLDRNHTHFILVDDGSDRKVAAEIEFRSAFEHFVSKKVVQCVAESQRAEVPVALLVVEGGINILNTVNEYIKKKIPVIVFCDSGRAAEFIASGYDFTKDPKNEDESQFPANFNKLMMDYGEKVFALSQNDDKEILDTCIKQLKDILDNRKLVNIFKLHEIDKAISYALLKDNTTSASAQLSLALSWNRCDIAKDEIFTKKNRQYWRGHNTDLYNNMFTALVQDRVDFVLLFLENGVSLKKFLSIDTLGNLYGIIESNFKNRTPVYRRSWCLEVRGDVIKNT